MRTVTGLDIREASTGDADAIAEVYAWYVANSNATFDVEAPDTEARRAWLEEHPGGRHRALAAELEGHVVGFASSSRFRPRPAYERTVETSVYVAHDHVGAGIGAALYGRLFDLLAAEDVHRVCAGISLPNDASVALHHRFGFREVGRFTEQGFKFERYWDVAWFEREMPGAPP